MTDDGRARRLSRAGIRRLIFLRPQTSLWFILVTYVVIAGCLGFVLAARTLNGTPIPNLTRDPQAIAALPVHAGFLSNVGVILWSATAAVCLFSYAVLRERRTDTTMARYLLFGGLISGMLLIDDLFMMHDAVFPRYLGTSDEVAYGAYMLITLAYFIWFRWTIPRTDYLLLVLASIGFGVSIVADVRHWFSYSSDISFFVEDGSKFFGIALWSAYFMSVSARVVGRSHADIEAAPDPGP